MPVHYFHCTDGTDLIIDRRGQRTRSKREVHLRAFSLAAEVMRAAPEVDWSQWIVSVHDRRGGMVATIPFPAGRA